MQGVILSAGRARSLILGDDGNRYAFTLEEWQGADAAPEAGMRVDFEVQGSDAVGHLPHSVLLAHAARSAVRRAPSRAAS